ncbi:MAG: BON domain-containing protein [Rhodospirillum sp.]|nr:BON domain-containing protein [Rhodospirillum sp.]MCF8491531.1 BON domain-containing protein [Rhodospirillum sp.]MCF8501411.1 BON domain-containing protein [Rhodospirillum sp.]
MMNKTRLLRAAITAAALVLVGLATGSMAACTATRTSQSSGEYLDDSVVTNKVRGAIIGDKDLSIFDINVETYRGVVQLSGFVDSANARSRAGAVAAGVAGVRQVRNDLIVK